MKCICKCRLKNGGELVHKFKLISYAVKTSLNAKSVHTKRAHKQGCSCNVERNYYAAMLLNIAQKRLRQKINQSSKPQRFPTRRAGYGVSVVKIQDKFDGIITAPHSTKEKHRTPTEIKTVWQNENDKTRWLIWFLFVMVHNHQNNHYERNYP